MTLPVYLLSTPPPELRFTKLSAYFQGSLSIARGHHTNMLIGSITNLWVSSAAAQQSINVFLLFSLFHSLKVVIPNLYHSRQVLHSLLLSSSFSAGNCQKKKWKTLAKNSLNCSLHLYYSHLPTPARHKLLSMLLVFPKLYLPSVNSNAALRVSSKATNCIFSFSVQFFSSIPLSPSAWKIGSKLTQTLNNK